MSYFAFHATLPAGDVAMLDDALDSTTGDLRARVSRSACHVALNAAPSAEPPLDVGGSGARPGYAHGAPVPGDRGGLGSDGAGSHEMGAGAQPNTRSGPSRSVSSPGQAAARVTVFIPTYNRAQWLEKAIHSVLSQEYEDFRLVVADNASTDETPETVAGFADPRISYIRRERNVGLFQNHTACLTDVDTEYALILSDDDLLQADHLARSVAVLDANPRVGMIHTAFDLIGPSGELLDAEVDWTHGLGGDAIEAGHEFLRQSMAGSCRVCPSTALIRARAIPPEPFLERDFPAIDFGLWLRLALEWDVAFLAQSLAQYRVHGSSHSASLDFDGSLGKGYLHGVETIASWRDLKLRFLETHGAHLPDQGSLRRSTGKAMRDSLVQMARDRTLPERRFAATMLAVGEVARLEPRVLGEINVWRLVAASILGRRGVERLKSRRHSYYG